MPHIDEKLIIQLELNTNQSINHAKALLVT